jgi:hypothetical protein
VERPPDRSLASKSQTHLQLSVSPDLFSGASGLTATAVSWPGEASRPFGCFGWRTGTQWRFALASSEAARPFGTGRERTNVCFGSLASLRPTERMQWSVFFLCPAQRNGVRRRQSWRVCRRALAKQCGHLARSEPMGAWETRSVRRTQRKCPLCEAGLLPFPPRSEATNRQ